MSRPDEIRARVTFASVAEMALLIGKPVTFGEPGVKCGTIMDVEQLGSIGLEEVLVTIRFDDPAMVQRWLGKEYMKVSVGADGGA